MKCSHCGADTKHSWGEGKLCELCYKKGAAPTVQGHNKPISASVLTPGDYQTGIGVSKIVTSIGWVVCAIAVLIILLSLSRIDEAEGVIALGSGIVAFIGGLLTIVSGQATRALLDNANYTRQILELLKKDN